MTDEFDRGSPLPLFRQVANWMETQITTGKWPPEYRLPGEIELAKTLKISRGSLRKALGLLIERELLVQVHGKGNFVAAGVVDQDWAGRLVAISDELLLQGIPFNRQVLEQRTWFANAREARDLDLLPGSRVLGIKRLWTVNGLPGFIHLALFDDNRFHRLADEDLAHVSLVEAMQRLFQVRLEWATHAIAVVRADASQANSLHIHRGDPLLYDEQVTYDDHDRKVVLVHGWYRADRFRLHTEAHRSDGE